MRCKLLALRTCGASSSTIIIYFCSAIFFICIFENKITANMTQISSYCAISSHLSPWASYLNCIVIICVFCFQILIMTISAHDTHFKCKPLPNKKLNIHIERQKTLMPSAHRVYRTLNCFCSDLVNNVSVFYTYLPRWINRFARFELLIIIALNQRWTKRFQV